MSIIKELQRQYTFNPEHPKVWKGYQKAIQNLAEELYKTDFHYLFEIIQNADDNFYESESPILKFLLKELLIEGKTKPCLIILNNETGFQKVNVEAICDIGSSTKEKNFDTIGEKGIGFKSVFRITDCPIIQSNEFLFKLPRIIDNGLGYITPLELSDKNFLKDLNSSNDLNTKIILPLKKTFASDEIINQLTNLSDYAIFFLRKLREISIEIDLPKRKSTRTIKRIDKGNKRTLEVTFDKKKVVREFFVYQKKFLKPENVNHLKREGASNRIIEIAFPIDQEVEKGVLFSYLPVYEKIDLPFFINSDFLLTSSREEVLEDLDWNKWLRNAIAQTYVDGLVSLLQSDSFPLKTKINFYKTIPSKTSGKTFLDPIIPEIYKLLKQAAFVIPYNYQNPSDLFRIDEVMQADKSILGLFDSSRKIPKAIEKREINLLNGEIKDENTIHILRKLGVKQFNLKTLHDNVLTDNSWMLENKQQWLLDLYDYIHKTNWGGISISDLPIVPIQGQLGFFSSREKNIYLEIHDKEKYEKLFGDYRKLINYEEVNQEFKAKILKRGISVDWLQKLGVYTFKDENLAIDCLDLLKEYNKHNLKNNDIINLTKITLDLNSILEKTDLKDLPIVLENEEIIRLDSSMKNLVVPEKYNKETGWQHIFNENERSHFQVVSKKYTKHVLDTFISTDLVQKYPDFEIKTITENDCRWGSKLSEHLLALFYSAKQKCSEQNKQYAKVKYKVIPEYFNKAEFDAKDAELISSFCLDRLRNNSPYHFDFHLFYDEIQFYYRGFGNDEVRNSFESTLQDKAWVLTENGEIKRPKDLFIQSPDSKKLLKDYVSFAKLNNPNFNNLISYLGASSQINGKALIKFILNNLTQKEVTLDYLISIYKALDKERIENQAYYSSLPKDISDAIIYVPNKIGKCWFVPNECIWESEIGEDENQKQFSLSSVYPDDLKELFLYFGAAEKHDVQYYYNQWKRLVDEKNTDFSKWDVVLRNIKSNTVEGNLLESLDENLNEEFKYEEIILCTNWQFYSTENVVFANDSTLREIFKDKLPFAYFPQIDGFKKWQSFFRELEIPSLSDNVTKELVEDDSDFKHQEQKLYLTKSTIILIAAYLKTNYEEEYKTALEEKLFDELMGCTEYFSEDEFIIRYEFDYGYNSEQIEQKATIFIESSFKSLNYWQDIENDDVAHELFISLKHFIELPDEFESKLENYLGVKDFIKRIEKEGLAFPDEVFALFKKNEIQENEPITNIEEIESDENDISLDDNIIDEENDFPTTNTKSAINLPFHNKAPKELPVLRKKASKPPREFIPKTLGEQIEKGLVAIEKENQKLQFKQSLLNSLSNFEKLTLGWLRQLILLEKKENNDDNQQKKYYNFTFYKVERDSKKDNIIILSEANGVIQNYIENFENFEFLFYTSNFNPIKLSIQSLSVNNSIVRARLNNADDFSDLENTDIEKVVLKVEKADFLWERLYENLSIFEDYDDSQIELLQLAKEKEMLSFIYGPPGTGKTTTIINRIKNEESKRTLILTPTNKSADVIVERLIKENPKRSFYRHGTTGSEIVEDHDCFIMKQIDSENDLADSIFVTTIHRYAYDTIEFEESETYEKIRDIEWDEIIVDEASMINLAQITDLFISTSNDTEIIIAGDPHQIRPILKMNEWKNMNIYSLVGLDAFNVKSPNLTHHKVESLTTQYRSVPSIGNIFSSFSYESKLKHHRDILGKPNYQLFNETPLKSLNVIKFPISENGIYKIQKVDNSPYQIYLSILFVEWFQNFIKQFSENSKKIGIICPYKAQTDIVYKLINTIKSEMAEHEIMINTVHGFQGDECDIIICLFNPSIGNSVNLNDKNILNVAVSRAKDYLILFVPENVKGISNLKHLIDLVEESTATISNAKDFELKLFNEKNYIENISFSTASQNINVFGKSNFKYEIRTNADSVTIQINNH